MLKVIDSGYFLFKWFLPLKTYRYGVCGAGNLMLDTILYFICFHFVFQKENFDLNLVVISPHIASLFVVFPITFIVGFSLNRYIVFTGSEFKLQTQLFRYILSGLTSLILSYLCMKLLVDTLSIYPTPSKVITSGITVIASYLMQNHFTFKVSDKK